MGAERSWVGRPLGEILVAHGRTTVARIDEALALQRERGGRLGELLVGMKAVTEADVVHALGLQFDLPVVEAIAAEAIQTEVVGPIPINYAKQYRVLPLRWVDEAVEVACADPVDTAPLDDLCAILGREVRPVLAAGQTILDAINRVFDRKSGVTDAAMDDLEGADLQNIAHELEEPQDLLDVDEEAPIIRLVNSLLFQSVKDRASDIHIEPMERDISVRFRVDGVLKEIMRPAKRYHASISSRVKIMAGLNIAEKRLPQDGRIRIKLAGKDIDIRVATAPTSHGERITMRLLDRSAVLVDLSSLGFQEDNYKVMQELIQRAHGILLVTGPTGSGKTTTLYACLAKINTKDQMIITVEDPVEYQLQGVSQIQVNPKIELTFAGGLRSILRHDPDVIMVGEIRDLETAEIAIQASLTGHLVFSTVHTNDAPGALTRLIDMGVEPFLLSSSLLAVLAQRLVRVVCKACRVPYQPSEAELVELGLDPNQSAGLTVFREKGCPACLNSGYVGRVGIYELMMIDDDVRDMTRRKLDSNTIKKLAIQRGMRTLRDDGLLKVVQGVTTISEVMRVTQEDVA
ncbi:MAG: type II secretion system ATPase GspE [Deltaproteobacteria bacterium]|nr:type II secretion system ATPase GspE [Deltaproteobacteria bacterium]